MGAETSLEELGLLPEGITEPIKSSGPVRMAMKKIEKFPQAALPDERHRRLQHISQFSSYLPDGTLQWLAAESLRDGDPRIRGEMCYALGRSGRPHFKSMLQPPLLNDPDPWVRGQASKALQMLDKATPEALAAPGVIPFDYAELLHQVSRLIEEIATLRKELTEAVARLAPQPDEYARQVLEEMNRNHEAYEREEPELLKKYAGQFAVFCDGELVTVGPDRREATLKAMQDRPTSRPYVRQVGVEIPSRPSGRR